MQSSRLCARSTIRSSETPSCHYPIPSRPFARTTGVIKRKPPTDLARRSQTGLGRVFGEGLSLEADDGRSCLSLGRVVERGLS